MTSSSTRRPAARGGGLPAQPGYRAFYLAATLARLASEMFTVAVVLLVPERLLAGANALEATSFNTAAIAGPAVAGAVAAGFGPATAVLVEAALAGLALLAIARLPRVTVPADDRAASLAGTIRQGLGHLAGTPVLRGVTVTTAVAMGGTGLFALALPFWAEQLGAGRAGAGYLWAALEAGAIAGALAATRPAAAWPPQRVVLAGLALFGLAIAAWPLAPSFPVALALVGLAGLVEGPAFAATFATRQRWSPPPLRGQIFTTAASLKIGAFAVGAALAGPALDRAGVGGTLLTVAAVQVLAVALGLATGARGAAQPPPA